MLFTIQLSQGLRGKVLKNLKWYLLNNDLMNCPSAHSFTQLSPATLMSCFFYFVHRTELFLGGSVVLCSSQHGEVELTLDPHPEATMASA